MSGRRKSGPWHSTRERDRERKRKRNERRIAQLRRKRRPGKGRK